MVNVLTGRARELLHDRDDTRRIDAARQKSAQRNVRHHLATDRALEDLLELVRRFRCIERNRVRNAGTRDFGAGPIMLDDRVGSAGSARVRSVPGQQFGDPAIDRARSRHVEIPQKQARAHRGRYPDRTPDAAAAP